MPTTPPNSPLTLPDRFVVYPIGVAAEEPISIALVAREQPDETHGTFIRLRDQVDGAVYLGGLVDRAMRVHRWLEVWVQSPERLRGSVQSAVRNITNQTLDLRWETLLRTMLDGEPAEVIATGWESEDGRLLGLDHEIGAIVPLRDLDTNEIWTLCRDEAVLRDRGLPGYAASLDRYLYLASKGEDSPLVAVTNEAPVAEGVDRLADVLATHPAFVPLNPTAGRLLVRPRSDLSLVSFLEFLHGEMKVADSAAVALEDPREIIEAAGVPICGHLFADRATREQRFLELILIKLRLINEILASTQVAVRGLRRPILDLAPESFGVRFAQPTANLPAFWTATSHLLDFGEALSYRVPGTDTVTFVRLSERSSPIYQPERLSETQVGIGTVRVRATNKTDDGSVVVEGTMLPTSPILVDRHDLVSIQIQLGADRLSLYTRLESKSALASDEFRFRTVPARFDEAATERLLDAEGAVFSNVSFEVIPRLGSPVDLFSLGIIAARILFGNSDRSIAVIKDELLSFARHVASNYDQSSSLRLRIQSLFRGDDRWLESLGPHLALGPETARSDAFAAVPIELWCEVLALLIRLFPGVGPDSWAEDYLGGQAGGLHQIFDGPVREAEELVARTRSVLFADWNENREINDLIRKQLDTHLAERIAENA